MRGSRFRVVVVLLAAVTTLCLPQAGDGALVRIAPFARTPGVMLWAWEQPQDLRFIDPARVGVAFLARTLELGHDGVRVRPRLQPLRVPDGTALVAVVRVETTRDLDRQDLDDLRAETAAAIVDVGRRPGLAGIQVDFDAAISERAFYRALLGDVRGALPDTLGLSMTALASWCAGDRWLDDLDVDEVVPMLFRMGADAHRVRLAVARGPFPCTRCRSSIGIATDEPDPGVGRSARVYVFHPGPWTRDAARTALAGIAR